MGQGNTPIPFPCNDGELLLKGLLAQPLGVLQHPLQVLRLLLLCACRAHKGGDLRRPHVKHSVRGARANDLMASEERHSDRARYIMLSI